MPNNQLTVLWCGDGVSGGRPESGSRDPSLREEAHRARFGPDERALRLL